MSSPKHESNDKPTLSSRLYKGLKFTALILLPAAGSVYFALAGIWHWPDAEQVIGSITVIDTALGGLVHVSSSNYNSNSDKSDPQQYDGDLIAANHDGDGALTVALNGPAANLLGKETVTFKVVRQ